MAAACSRSWLHSAGCGPSCAPWCGMSPALVHAAIAGGSTADTVKEKLFIRLLGGMPVDEVDRRATAFAHRHLQHHLRDDMRRRLEWHHEQGHYTVIVSASPECYVQPGGRRARGRRRRGDAAGRGRRRPAHRGLRGQEQPRRREVRPPRRPPAGRGPPPTPGASSPSCGPTATAGATSGSSTRPTTASTWVASAASAGCAGSPGCHRSPMSPARRASRIRPARPGRHRPPIPEPCGPGLPVGELWERTVGYC